MRDKVGTRETEICAEFSLPQMPLGKTKKALAFFRIMDYTEKVILMEELKQQIKELIVSALELEDIAPEDIQDDAPLFGTGLGLDSIDALELGVALKKKFDVKLSAESEDSKKHFASVNSLAEFIQSERSK